MIWICSLKLHLAFFKMKLLLISLKFILFNSPKITKFDRVGSRGSIMLYTQSLCRSRKLWCLFYGTSEMHMNHRNAQDFHKEEMWLWNTPKPVYFQKYSALLWLKVVCMQGKIKLICRYVGIMLYTQSSFAKQSKALGLWEFCDGWVFDKNSRFLLTSHRLVTMTMFHTRSECCKFLLRLFF